MDLAEWIRSGKLSTIKTSLVTQPALLMKATTHNRQIANKRVLMMTIAAMMMGKAVKMRSTRSITSPRNSGTTHLALTKRTVMISSLSQETTRIRQKAIKTKV